MSTPAQSLLLVVVTLAFWAHVGSHHHSVLCLVSGDSGDPDWSGDVLTHKPPDYYYTNHQRWFCVKVSFNNGVPVKMNIIFFGQYDERVQVTTITVQLGTSP